MIARVGVAHGLEDRDLDRGSGSVCDLVPLVRGLLGELVPRGSGNRQETGNDGGGAPSERK